jgi:hypothetical protein
MEFEAAVPWLQVISALSVLVIGLFTALWAYMKFVLERGLLPPVQFDIDCNAVGPQNDQILLEVVLYLRNRGTARCCAPRPTVSGLWARGPGVTSAPSDSLEQARRKPEAA